MGSCKGNVDLESLGRPENRLLSVAQAAQYLGCSTDTVRRLKAKGTLPFVQFSRNILFDKSDLDKFVEQHKFTEPY